MATTITLKPIQLKIRLLDAISSSHHKIQSLSPISDHLLPAASSLSGFLPFSSLGAFTTSYLCLFSVLTVPQPSFKVLLFTDASSATFPYYMHGVSCVPCVLHPVPCVLCAIHPPRPSPHPPLTLYHSLLLCDTSREWSHLLKLFLVHPPLPPPYHHPVQNIQPKVDIILLCERRPNKKNL